MKFEFHGRWKNSYTQARFLLYLNVGFRGIFSVRMTDCKSNQNVTPYVAMVRSRPAHLYIANCMQFLGYKKNSFFNDSLFLSLRKNNFLKGKTFRKRLQEPNHKLGVDSSENHNRWEGSYLSIWNRYSWFGACWVCFFFSIHSAHLPTNLWIRIKRAIWGEWSCETHYTAFNGISVPKQKSSLWCNSRTFARKGDRSYNSPIWWISTKIFKQLR